MRRLMTTVTSLGLMLFVTPVMAGPVTNLGNVRIVDRVELVRVPAGVKYVFNRDIGPGRLKKTSDGEEGVIRKTVREVIFGGKKLGCQTVKIEKKKPEPATIEMGRSGFATSRGAFSRSKVMTVTATAYTPYDPGCNGRTATGRRAKYGIIAVDPRVIPLHSLVYVEGYGFAVAADTGGAIKGNKIDVCFPSLARVTQWGRKKVVIHVFKEKVGKSE